MDIQITKKIRDTYAPIIENKAVNVISDNDSMVLTRAEKNKIEYLFDVNDYSTGETASRVAADNELYTRINQITTGLIYQEPVSTFTQLEILYPTPDIYWAALVLDENLVYSFNGDTWVNTGLNPFPEDVLLYSTQTLTTPQKLQARTNIYAASIDDVNLAIVLAL